MQQEKKENEILSLSECAEYGNVTRQAIYRLIINERLKAKQISNRWFISKQDYDEFRADKFNRDKRKFQHEFIFDVAKGCFSIQQVGKVISHTLKRKYPIQRIYYLLRKGKLHGIKKGASWVISRDDAVSLLHQEILKEEQQLDLFEKMA